MNASFEYQFTNTIALDQPHRNIPQIAQLLLKVNITNMLAPVVLKDN